jgi:hypothetical protein
MLMPRRPSQNHGDHSSQSLRRSLLRQRAPNTFVPTSISPGQPPKSPSWGPEGAANIVLPPRTQRSD